MGRREITGKTPTEEVFNQLAFTASSLTLAGEDGDAVVGALAPPLEEVLHAGEALHAERRARQRQGMHVTALVRRRSLQADERLVAVRNGTLAQLNFDRSDPLFVRLFPEPPSAIVSLGLGNKLTVLRTLRGKIEDRETPAGLRKEHGKALGESIQRSEAGLKLRDEARVAAERTGARIAAWRDDANSALMAVEGALKMAAASRRAGRGWVDSFFATSEPIRRAKAKPEGAVATP